MKSRLGKFFTLINSLTFDPSNEPVVLQFSSEAQAIFDDWQGKHERRIRGGDLSPHMEAHLAKFKKLLPALCLIFEHIQCAVCGIPNEINANTLLTALEWLQYFESHAIKVYSSGVNTVPKTALELLHRIRKRTIKEPFSARDVYHGHHWSGLSTSEEVEEVLEYLVEKNYLAGSFVKTNGRPTTKYWVNPKVFEEKD